MPSPTVSSHRCVALLLVLTVGVLAGCRHRLAWVIEDHGDAGAHDAGAPASEGDRESVVRWRAITPGPCSPTPPEPLWSGGPAEMAPAVERGVHCFWSMAVRTYTRDAAPNALPPCRLEALAFDDRDLPGEDGELRLLEQPVLSSERASWDRAVTTIARCAPVRDPARCECPYTGGDGTDCVLPLVGDLVAMGPRHACVASTGSTEAWCWGDRRGFGGEGLGPPERLEVLLDGEVAIQQIAAGETMTCARTASGTVACIGQNRTSLVRVDARRYLRAAQIALGGDLGCGLAANGALGLSVYCWRDEGRRGALDAFATPVLEDADGVDELTMGDGFGCVRQGRALGCAVTAPDGWSLVSFAGSFLDIASGGSYVCGQITNEEFSYRCLRYETGGTFVPALDTGPAASLSVSDESWCARSASVTCLDWIDGGREPATLASRTGASFATAEAGPGIACGTTPESGALRCVRIGTSADGDALLAEGRRATASGLDVICRYP